jgi:hypothetical protein
VSLAGLILLFAWRQNYDRPPGDLNKGVRSGEFQQSVPDSLTPAVGGVVAANGRPALEHAVAALFGAAERGAIGIRENPRGLFGQRDFTVTRGAGSSRLPRYEQAAIDIIFKKQPGPSASVTLSQARSRLSRGLRQFAREITGELADAGLLDHARKAIRDRYNRAAIVLLALAGLATVPAILVTREYGGWPLLIPAALSLVAIASFIFGATTTPLSNDGVRRGALWRDYRRYLAAVARDRQPASGVPIASVLPFAVALGLAESWSKFLKRHAYPAPPWFHPLSASDAHAAFPAFIATGGTGASCGGGSGAAGGGASGAG